MGVVVVGLIVTAVRDAAVVAGTVVDGAWSDETVGTFDSLSGDGSDGPAATGWESRTPKPTTTTKAKSRSAVGNTATRQRPRRCLACFGTYLLI
jgi:hypothetical protein